MSAVDGVLAGMKMRRDAAKQLVDDQEAADDLPAKREERSLHCSDRERAARTAARVLARMVPRDRYLPPSCMDRGVAFALFDELVAAIAAQAKDSSPTSIEFNTQTRMVLSRGYCEQHGRAK